MTATRVHVDVPLWCVVHDARTPCSSCAGDHRAGDHRGLPAIPSCPACEPIPVRHTTYTDRSTNTP
jgi:hypothetical protein